MDTNLIRIPKEYKKNNQSFIVNSIEVKLAPYIISSISKFAFMIEDNTIYLCRKCNSCTKYFKVQRYINGVYENLNELPIKYKGPISGFESICYKCDSDSKFKNIPISLKDIDKDNMVQLNIKVDSEIKKYYRTLAAKNNTRLGTELTNALLFYKEHKK